MLDTGTDHSDPVLEELLGVDQLWLKLILVIACTKHIIFTHTPGIQLITLLA